MRWEEVTEALTILRAGSVNFNKKKSPESLASLSEKRKEPVANVRQDVKLASHM